MNILLQQLFSSVKFQRDMIIKTRMTVDDSSTGLPVAIHCMLSQDFCVVACTKQDYPTRVIFNGPNGGLLHKLATLASQELGGEVFSTGAGMDGAMRKVQLSSHMAQQLERICADYEDAGAHDKVYKVQQDVDDVREVMQGNIDALLTNHDQLTSLQSKTDDIANASRGFYREARTARRSMQCEESKFKLILVGVSVVILLFLFRGIIWGEDSSQKTS